MIFKRVSFPHPFKILITPYFKFYFLKYSNLIYKIQIHILKLEKKSSLDMNSHLLLKILCHVCLSDSIWIEFNLFFFILLTTNHYIYAYSGEDQIMRES